MNLDTLKKFLDKCHESNITPPNGILIVIDDFEEAVPEEIAHIGQCEYNHRIGNDILTVEITSKKILEIGFEQSKEYRG